MNYFFDKEEVQYEKVITEAITAIQDVKEASWQKQNRETC